MSVDLLRRAAKEMREKAEAATPSPWTNDGHDDDEGGCSLLGGGVHCSSAEYGIAYTTAFTNRRCDEDAEHIASWHPAVALAAADLLDMCARVYLEKPEVLAFARAYLGDAYLGEAS